MKVSFALLPLGYVVANETFRVWGSRALYLRKEFHSVLVIIVPEVANETCGRA